MGTQQQALFFQVPVKMEMHWALFPCSGQLSVSVLNASRTRRRKQHSIEATGLPCFSNVVYRKRKSFELTDIGSVSKSHVFSSSTRRCFALRGPHNEENSALSRGRNFSVLRDCTSRRGSASLQKAITGSSSSVEQPVESSEDKSLNEIEIFENGAATFDGKDSTISGDEFASTLRLVESAMLAAAVGLAYFLSNLLRIENYFGCFFPLPPVIASLRWGVVAGRKTMVATAMLLFVLSGPLKAATYLLMHGFLGLAMGTLWRLELSWGVSVLICTLVRSSGAMGFVFLSSWLLRDNVLALITINAHASISFMLAAVGINIVPSMGSIYFIFGTLVLLNCGSFVFLLHVLYAIFLRRLGLNPSVIFPAWLKAL